MTDKRGREVCPKCGFHILARVDNRIFCLNNGCEWSIDSKRKDDKDIPEIHTLQDNWK